ncbi:hypothetical protein RJ641_004255 [Dillenia turbinata]|uniref:TOG domain-containing protein n=1 Tax=Dillenia turbinata TaxID=194707 RepID=A0AAN8VI15_9MAGN
MALRSLDNALPITPERPKRQTKVAVSIPKLSEPSANDENRFPSAPIADATIDYISSENLKPISDPESNIQSLNDGMDSKDWTKVCESLNNARRFALFHPSLLLPNLEKVVMILVKAIKNPRSAICKTSLMASSDIFKAFGDNLLEFTDFDAFNQLLLQLLLKASQDKRFVCEEADRALHAMVGSMKPLPLLHKLQSCVGHANLRVRAKAAISISHCVSKMGLEGMNEFGFVPLLHIAVDSLNDRLPEAREAARSVVMSVHEAFMESEDKGEESWESFCHSNLAPIHAQAIVKLISSQEYPSLGH